MSDATYIGNRARSIKTSPEFDGLSKVVLVVSDELQYESGTDTGRTITVRSPWGSQRIADDILARLQGFQYQPYTATGASIDPAAELGDGVTVGGIYSGIFEETLIFGKDFAADLAAPFEEELDHEYPYVSPQQRQIQRQYAQIRSTFKVQADQINARVEKSGGDIKSFGWDLTADSWTLSSGNKEVLVANENGLSIEGEIRATSGKIGGFDIKDTYLTYNNQEWNGKNTLGAYLGINGLQLGKNFRVDMEGNLTANSGTFNGTICAKNISYGGNSGTLNGAAISTGSIAKGLLVSGVQTTLNRADSAYNVLFNNAQANAIACKQVSAGQILLNGKNLGMSTITYTDQDGTAHAINVVTWAVR